MCTFIFLHLVEYVRFNLSMLTSMLRLGPFNIIPGFNIAYKTRRLLQNRPVVLFSCEAKNMDTHTLWQCAHVVSVASEAGHKAEADSQVRPSEERGPSPYRAMDAGQSVQWQCLCVEPWNTGMRRDPWARETDWCQIKVKINQYLLLVFKRLLWRPLKCVTFLSERQSLWQERTGSSLERWELHHNVYICTMTAVASIWGKKN